MHILRNNLFQVTGWWMFVQQRIKQLETHGCVLGIVVTNALYLKHQANSIHSTHQIPIALGKFQTKKLYLWESTLEKKSYILNNSPNCLRVKSL